LAVICAPIGALGAVDLVLNPTEWPYAIALVTLALVVTGYNFTARLSIDANFITFRRYGRVVWRAPRSGSQVKDGMAGDVPFLRSLIIWREGKKVGFVAKGWFDDAALTELRNAVLP
jgi:hypothetical protein